VWAGPFAGGEATGSGFVRITGFVAAFVAFSAQGAQDVLITQTVDRSNSVYHRQGYAAIAPEVTESIGGVLSQAAVVADQINPLSVIFPDVEGTRDPGYILVRRGTTEARLPIAYSELVPIALFVDGRATALFTLHNPLPKDFERSAGFVRSDVGGRIALEFRGTRFENPLYSADLDRPLLGQNEPTLVIAANAGLRAFGLMTPANLQRNWSYINTDVGRTYTLALDHERAEISGGIVRYSWRVTDTGDRQNYEIMIANPLFNRAAVEQATGAARSRTTQAWQTLRSEVENLNRELARSPSTVPSNDALRQLIQQTSSI
jgi:hypothetical protein